MARFTIAPLAPPAPAPVFMSEESSRPLSGFLKMATR
jgi:hypothetical protein